MKNKDFIIRNVPTFISIKDELLSIAAAISKSKRSKIVIFIVFILMILFAFYTYAPKTNDYYQVKKSNQWQTYENKRYGFSVKYPNSWIKGADPENNDGISLYTNKPEVEIIVYASHINYDIKTPHDSWNTPGSIMDNTVTLDDGTSATLISGKMGDKYFIDLVVLEEQKEQIEYHYYAKVSPWFYKANKKTLLKSAKSLTLKDSPDFSYYEDLIKQDQEVVIKKPELVDLTGDGKSEIIYITSGENCASCHDQTIRIFDGQKEIFSLLSDDVVLIPLKENGFSLRKPIRKEGEPLCCPTEFGASFYFWDGQTFQEQK